jgi:two-component system response regulator BaeR
VNEGGPRRTVFVVEDDPKIGAVLRDDLVAAGHRVETFRGGPPAVEAARHDPPALVLLDLMLPGMDGVAVCRELRAFCASPVLMLTARVLEGDRIIGLEAGADDHVCKPFHIENIRRKIAAVDPQATCVASVYGVGYRWDAPCRGSDHR